MVTSKVCSSLITHDFIVKTNITCFICTGQTEGSSYIRWGRKTCESHASLVYTGNIHAPLCSLFHLLFQRSQHTARVQGNGAEPHLI